MPDQRIFMVSKHGPGMMGLVASLVWALEQLLGVQRKWCLGPVRTVTTL